MGNEGGGSFHLDSERCLHFLRVGCVCGGGDEGVARGEGGAEGGGREMREGDRFSSTPSVVCIACVWGGCVWGGG